MLRYVLIIRKIRLEDKIVSVVSDQERRSKREKKKEGVGGKSRRKIRMEK